MSSFQFDYSLIPTESSLSPIIVDDAQELHKLVKILRSEQSLAIDVESDQNHHYGRNLSLIQIGTQAFDTYVIDTQFMEVDELRVLFEDPAIEKIFYAGVQDIQMIKSGLRCDVRNVFDVAIAYYYLRGNFTLPRPMDYVINEVLGLELTKSKKLQRCDWSLRPLTEEMAHYAALDVAYLIPVRQIFGNELTERNMGTNLRHYFHSFELVEEVDPEVEKTLVFLKLKGYSRLDPLEKVIVRALYDRRDIIAKKKNKPPYFIIGNRQILYLAQTKPKHLGELVNKREFKKLVQSYPKRMEHFLRIIQRTRHAVEQGKLSYERDIRPLEKVYNQLGQQNVTLLDSSLQLRSEGQLTPQEFKLKLGHLEKWRRRKADELECDPNLFLSRYTCQQLVLLDWSKRKNLPDGMIGLGKEVKKHYGKELLSLLKN